MKSRMLVWLTMILVILMMTSASAPAAAHLPIYGSGGSTMDTALEIPDADVSYAIFAEFSTPDNRIHFYAFSVEAGHLLNFQLSVPAIDGLQDFAPVIILIGPGIPVPDSDTSELLSEFNVILPSGHGAVTYAYEGTSNEVEFEPFTQINLWIRQEAEVVLPSQGVYYIAVAVPQDTTHDATEGFGKYVLAPGKLEEFGIMDYVLIPVDWLKTQAFFEHNLLVFTLPTIVVAAFVSAGTWFYLRKRRPDALSELTKSRKTAFMLAATGAAIIIGAALNQLLLILGYTGFSPEGADFIAIMLQSIGLFLGLGALGLSLRLVSPRSLIEIIVLVIVALGALVVGTGFIVGPVVFLIGGSAELLLGRKLSGVEKSE